MRTFVTFLFFVFIAACGDTSVKGKRGPAPANNTTSNNVSTNCGNGTLEPGEACDPAIESGEGACPTSCAAPACASASLEGSPDTCDARCNVQPVACAAGDGCCPEGCDSSTDSDCTNTCGNGLVEPPETCDTNCPATCDDGNACTTGDSNNVSLNMLLGG